MASTSPRSSPPPTTPGGTTGSSSSAPDGRKLEDEHEAGIEAADRRGRLGAGGVPGTGPRARRSARRLPAGARSPPSSSTSPGAGCCSTAPTGRPIGRRPSVFERLGAARGDDRRRSPTGATSTRAAAPPTRSCWPRRVRRGDAEIGFAFDGDGDRVIAVDAEGEIRDGDELIALCARHLADAGALHGGVAVTVMSNYGFHQAMAEAGIEVATTPVGDRHVSRPSSTGGAGRSAGSSPATSSGTSTGPPATGSPRRCS